MSTPVHKTIIGFLALALVIMLGFAIDARIPVAPHRADQLNEAGRLSETVPRNLVVGTYNIRGAKGDKGADTGTPLADFIGILSHPPAHIVGLNEVRTSSLKQTNQAEQLSELMGASWWFASTARRLLSQELGNGVLATIPVNRVEVVPLLWSATADDKGVTGNSHRNLIRLHLELAGEPAVVMITHLDRGPLRMQQLAQVIAEMRQYDKAILLGDLNTGHDELTTLTDQTAIVDAVCAGNGRTEDHIDHILVKGFHVVTTGEHPRGLSDHPYYWAELAPGH